MKISKVLTILAILTISSVSLLGCATHFPVETPICVPLREFVLQPLTVAEQLAIKRLDGGVTLRKIATNDAKLKVQIVILERVIDAHDESLGSCD